MVVVVVVVIKCFSGFGFSWTPVAMLARWGRPPPPSQAAGHEPRRRGKAATARASKEGATCAHGQPWVAGRAGSRQREAGREALPELRRGCLPGGEESLRSSGPRPGSGASKPS